MSTRRDPEASLHRDLEDRSHARTVESDPMERRRFLKVAAAAAAASGAARRAVRKNVRGEQDYDLGVVLRRSIVGRYDATEDFSNSYYRY